MYVSACVHVCTHIIMYICTSKCMYISAHSLYEYLRCVAHHCCVCVSLCISICTCIYTRMSLYMCVEVRLNIHSYVLVWAACTSASTVLLTRVLPV